MAYGESNGHVIDDVTWPATVGRRRARLVEIAFYSLFLLFCRRRILRYAWTDFHETLTGDAVWIEKVYLLVLPFSVPPKDSGGKHVRLWPCIPLPVNRIFILKKRKLTFTMHKRTTYPDAKVTAFSVVGIQTLIEVGSKYPGIQAGWLAAFSASCFSCKS